MKSMNVLFSTAAALGLILGAGALQAADPLNDSQILGLINVANNAEISAGKVAATKGQKQEVKDFGTKMVIEHTASNARVAALEVKTKLKRATSESAKELKKNTDAMIDNLKNAKDVDFDRTYIDGQVMMHQELLKALDQNLIPVAQNPDLKTFLTELRADVDAHLQEALKIQAGLAGPAPTPGPSPTPSPAPTATP